jgi:hypothetical protein
MAVDWAEPSVAWRASNSVATTAAKRVYSRVECSAERRAVSRDERWADLTEHSMAVLTAAHWVDETACWKAATKVGPMVEMLGYQRAARRAGVKDRRLVDKTAQQMADMKALRKAGWRACDWAAKRAVSTADNLDVLKAVWKVVLMAACSAERRVPQSVGARADWKADAKGGQTAVMWGGHLVVGKVSQMVGSTAVHSVARRVVATADWLELRWAASTVSRKVVCLVEPWVEGSAVWKGAPRADSKADHSAASKAVQKADQMESLSDASRAG